MYQILVAIVMGSDSDLAVMKEAADVLRYFDVTHEVRILSAHRTADAMFEYAQAARKRGILSIIAGAGGGTHLPGMIAAITSIPVIGVPIKRLLSEWTRFPSFYCSNAPGGARCNRSY